VYVCWMRPAGIVALIGLGLIGCSGDESGDEVRVADAYADAVQVVVTHAEPPETSDEGMLVVWIYPLLDGSPIDLEVQVEMLDELDDFAEVRFADSFDEAVEDAEDDPSVLDDGVAVGLGAFEPPSDEIVASLFVTGDRQPSDFLVVRRAGRWQLADPSS
jgi:hypothetical protein